MRFVNLKTLVSSLESLVLEATTCTFLRISRRDIQYWKQRSCSKHEVHNDCLPHIQDLENAIREEVSGADMNTTKAQEEKTTTHQQHTSKTNNDTTT